MATYFEVMETAENAKKRGLNKSAFLVALCNKFAMNMKKAEEKYLGLLHICVNMENRDAAMLLWEKIRFDDVTSDKWKLVAYRRCPKRFSESGEVATIHDNLTMPVLLAIKRKCVMATGKERVIRVEMFYGDKLVKTV
jgi:hypothetical protein